MGVKGTLIKAAELGHITEVTWGTPKCFCPDELLVHLRTADLPVADVGAPTTQGDDQSSGRLAGAIVARFDPEFSSGTSDTISLGLNREKIRLFDPQSGASLLNRGGTTRFATANPERPAARSTAP